MEHLTDEVLIAEVQKGNEEAYTILYQRYVHALYRYLYHLLSDRAQAEDLVQETFLKVFQHAGQYLREKAQVRTWIHRIAYHLYVDHERKQRKFRWFSFVKLAPIPAKSPPLETHVLLDECLMQLSQIDRSVLILAYYQGMTGKEIAEILQIPPGTVKSKLHYALQKLKTWAKEEQRNEKPFR